MTFVGRTGLLLAVVLVSPGAYADEATPMDQHWKALPHVHEVDIGDQITDHLTELGNSLGEHLDLLSHDYFKIHVDGRAQRARMRLGGGNARYLELRVDSDWHFAEGKARVAARVQLALADRRPPAPAALAADREALARHFDRMVAALGLAP